MEALNTPHGYYPLGVELPHYVANESSVVSLIARFGFQWAAVLVGSYQLFGYLRPTAKSSDRLAFTWMCLTGFIHLFFEAHFVSNHKTLAADQSLWSQLWKEYSLSDSRYLTSDTFLLCMEAVTAFAWGPLAFLIAYCIVVQHPARHALQLIISTGQIYGDVLYYATSLLEISYCRPERYYFWFYYFFFNFIWMVVGCYYVKQSVTEIWSVFDKVKKAESFANNEKRFAKGEEAMGQKRK